MRLGVAELGVMEIDPLDGVFGARAVLGVPKSRRRTVDGVV